MTENAQRNREAEVNLLAAAREAQWSAAAFMGPNTMKLVSPAKVNLLLAIGARREDGYHDADTIMHALALMCAGLMHQARVARCVYGAPDQKAGAVGTLYDIHADTRLNHQFEATGGVCEEECVALLRDFFRARRRKEKERE